ncbi:MAG: transcription termination factor Rho [Clostridiales bacterium]|nr:transcription termination factor Rho [Clostridiales bacterium]
MTEIITERQRECFVGYIDLIYDKKTVHEVRALAKALGEPSPTSKKKEENWVIIKGLLSGEIQPKYSKSNDEKDFASYKKIVAEWYDQILNVKPLEFNNSKEITLSAPSMVLEDDGSDGVEGWLDIIERGYGFLRTKGADVFVDGQLIQTYRLREHDVIRGLAKKQDPNAKSAKLTQIVLVNGIHVDKHVKLNRPRFEDLQATFPNKRLRLENKDNFNFALRAIDLVAPLGRGQRALIVSPPKAGKTTLLKQMAQSLIANYSDLEVIMLLIDERPEEVTDMQNEVQGCTIVSSTFDQDQQHHVFVAEQTLAKAKRMVESGKDVVILLDSITRLARAYNQVGEFSGRTLSGGLDVAALKEPKKFFGAARNTANSGSLTIIATALVGTGSRMDDVIYEEFKGTGNMEIHLDRKLSERRIFPAIDLEKSGTRREDLLYDQRELTNMWAVRRMLSKQDNGDGIENILDMLTKTKTNDEFLTLLEISLQKANKQ